MTNQPDYDFLVKLDKWTKKDAALILSGHDPSQYKHVRFNQDELPAGLNSVSCSQSKSRCYWQLK